MMTIAAWLTILAVLLAPLIAVQVQKRLEMLRERRQRKLKVFEALMATRGARVSQQHVEALNMIDIEFRDRKLLGYSHRTLGDRKIREAWKIYLDHLNTPYTQEKFQEWVVKGDELFVGLLYEMGGALGYDFDRVVLKKGCYTPVAHGNFQLYQKFLQDGLLAILTGKQAIPVRLVDGAPPTSEAERKHEA